MESNKVKGLIFPVGGEAQAFLADRDRPYRDIREAVQGEYDELGATFADVDIYVNAAGADSLLPNRAINPDAFMDDSGFLSEKSLIVGTNDGKPFSLIFGNIVTVFSYPSEDSDQSASNQSVFVVRKGAFKRFSFSPFIFS